MNGEKNQEVQLGDKTKVENNTGGINTTYKEEVPLEFMLLMVLGWLLPSPQEIWKGFIRLLPWVNK